MAQQSAGFGRRNVTASVPPTHRETSRTPKVHALHTGGVLPSRGDTVSGGGAGSAIAAELSYPAPANAASEVEMMRFIGANWPKYRDMWLEMKHDATPRVGWSWAAFFLSDFWLFYRKQYAIAFCLLAIKIALAFMGFDGLSKILSLAVCGALGTYGKSLIVRRGMSTIGHIKALQLPPDMEARRIEKAGGASFAGPVMFIVLLFVAGAILAGANHAAKLSKGKERVRAGQQQSMLIESDR